LPSESAVHLLDEQALELEPTETPIAPLSNVRLNRQARRRLAFMLRACWQRRGLFVRSMAWAALISLVLLCVLPSRYSSTARLMPPEPNVGAHLAMAAVLGPAASVASDVLGMKSPGALLVGVLTSETVENALVNRFDLRKLYSCRKYSRAREILASRTSISEDRKSGIITIQVSDSDPARAAALTQAYVDELNRVLASVSTSAARRERIFLEARLAEVRRDLDSAERELSQFSSQHRTVDLKDEGHALVESGARLQGELIAEQAQLRGLQQVYGDQNVRVRSSRARIAELQGELEKLGGMSAEPETAAGDERFYPSLRRLPLLGLTFTGLYRQAKVEEVLFETLTKQYELARVQEAKDTPTARLLDEARVPDEGSYPPRLLLVIAGILLGFIAAAVWIPVSEVWLAADEDDPLKCLLTEVLQVFSQWSAGLRARLTRRRKSPLPAEVQSGAD